MQVLKGLNNFFWINTKKIRNSLEMEEMYFCSIYVAICVQECESGLQVPKSEVKRVIENSGNEKN